MVCLGLTLLLMTGSVGAEEAPALSAASAVLMDADSGRILYAKNADESQLIASTTKLLTALTALESGHSLDEVVTVRPEWTGIEGSSLYLRAGEEITLEELLYGLLLRSGNDAAQAVAGYCAESVEAFVERMNETARRLGMTDSRFANPSGLDHPEHYSTARDMAVLARACLENEKLRTIVSTRSVTMGSRILTNHNKLLSQYEGCIGLKTGFTEKAGRTLVSAAERDGMTLICVTLNAPDDWRDHAALFDYGFARYGRRCLVGEGEPVCKMSVQGSLVPLREVQACRSLWAALAEGEEPEQVIVLEEERTSPLGKNECVGEVLYTLNGVELGRTDLIVAQTVPCDLAPERSGILKFFGR